MNAQEQYGHWTMTIINDNSPHSLILVSIKCVYSIRYYDS